MKRYLVAYATWLASVLTVGAALVAWYCHVQGVALRDALAWSPADLLDEDDG